MGRIMNALSSIFNRGSQEELGALIEALQKAIDQTGVDANKLMLEYVVSTSTGEWLDELGSWFGVYRVQWENDDVYRSRIIAVATKPKNTPNAIITSIKAYVDDPNAEVRIYEPYEDLFVYGESRYSDKDYIEDGDYWRHAVIDIVITNGYKAGVESMIQFVRSAGIRVYFTFEITIGGELDKPPITMAHRSFEDYLMFIDMKIDKATNLLVEGHCFTEHSVKTPYEVAVPRFNFLSQKDMLGIMPQTLRGTEVISEKTSKVGIIGNPFVKTNDLVCVDMVCPSAYRFNIWSRVSIEPFLNMTILELEDMLGTYMEPTIEIEVEKIPRVI